MPSRHTSMRPIPEDRPRDRFRRTHRVQSLLARRAWRYRAVPPLSIQDSAATGRFASSDSSSCRPPHEIQWRNPQVLRKPLNQLDRDLLLPASLNATQLTCAEKDRSSEFILRHETGSAQPTNLLAEFSSAKRPGGFESPYFHTTPCFARQPRAFSKLRGSSRADRFICVTRHPIHLKLIMSSPKPKFRSENWVSSLRENRFANMASTTFPAGERV